MGNESFCRHKLVMQLYFGIDNPNLLFAYHCEDLLSRLISDNECVMSIDKMKSNLEYIYACIMNGEIDRLNLKGGNSNG